MKAHQPPAEKLDGAAPTGPGLRSWLGVPLSTFIALVCGMAIAGIWLATLQRISFEREQAVAAAMKSNASLAIAFEQQIIRTLKAAEQIASFVRQQYLQHGPDIDLSQWISGRVVRKAMFTIINVVDENGTVVSSSQATGKVNYADREFFLAQRDSTLDELFVSPPVLGRVSGRWQIPMSLRISRADGSFAGVVVMSVDPAEFTDFHRQADLGGQGLLEFTGLDGIVRARKIGERASFGVDASHLAWFQRQILTPEGDFMDNGDASDDVDRVISYRSLADYPLMVTVGTAYLDELAPVLQRRTTYLVMAATATAALVVFAGLMLVLLARQRSAVEALHASEALFRATFHQAAMGIAHIAPDGRILGANDKFCHMLGYSRGELRSRTLFELSDPQDREAVQQFMQQRLSAAAPAASPEIEKAYRRKDGSLLWVCEALGVVTDTQRKPALLVAVSQDITARKDLEERLSHDALHDALTGLPNRAMFFDRVARVLESARRHGAAAAVLYVDLDGFKCVNDSHGHAAGDALLQQVARRLEHCVRAEDTVARLGGDEFGIVLATLTRAQDCEAVAHKIIDALSRPFEITGAVVRISASAGAAVFPTHGEDTATLVAQADAAMYAAKRAGKNRFSWGGTGSDTVTAPTALQAADE